MSEQTAASVKKMKVSEMVNALPNDIVLKEKLRPNSSRTVVQELYAEHFNVNMTETEEPEKAKSLSDFIAEAKKENPKDIYKDKVYVSSFSNFNLQPKGINNRGKLMRYAAGYDTLEIKEQNENNPEGVFVDLIHFEKYAEVEDYFTIEDFGIVRSSIFVSKDNTMLQEYLETHKNYGVFFIEYDEKKKKRLAIIERERKAKLEAGVREATRDELLIPLVYIDSINGVDSFEHLSVLDIYDLKDKAYEAADFETDEFMEASQSNRAKVLHLANIAKRDAIIQVTDGGRSIVWTGNKQLITTVPIGRLWADEMIEFLLMPENSNILSKLSEVLSFKIV